MCLNSKFPGGEVRVFLLEEAVWNDGLILWDHVGADLQGKLHSLSADNMHAPHLHIMTFFESIYIGRLVLKITCG